MKTRFNARAPSFDADAIQQAIERALASAGLETRSGLMQGVTDTIRRALGAGGAADDTPREGPRSVIDVEAGVLGPDAPMPAAAATGPAADRAPARAGGMQTQRYGNAAGSRVYKVHVPSGPSGTPLAPRPVVVMLHGCTQSADDFAAGTQMNRLADEHGFLVVYPEQTSQANPSKCWNWFKPEDQARGAGEPSLIAGIVREAVQRHGGDPRRVYVAGLSAGAAMAVVLGQTYPELFAGVGAHSGLPYGSAHDIPSALAAMKGGRSGRQGPPQAAAAAGAPRQPARQAVPVIVFHGDRDHTVQASNGAQIVQQAQEAHALQAAQGSRTGQPRQPALGALSAHTQAGVARGGRRYSRTVHTDAAGQVRIESWTLHGAGHAWAGGHASGTFTDGSGPDASAEMVRFFLALPGAGKA